MQILTKKNDHSSGLTKINERELQFTFSSGRPTIRYAWHGAVPEGTSFKFEEILSQKEEDWDLERVTNDVCPFMLNHKQEKIGLVLNVDFLEGDRIACKVKLSRSQKAQQYLQDVEDGIAGGISFGYLVNKYELLEKALYELDEDGRKKIIRHSKLLGKEITLYEISAVDLPADPTVGYGKSENSPILLKSENLDSFTLEEIKNIENIATAQGYMENTKEVENTKEKSLQEKLEEANITIANLQAKNAVLENNGNGEMFATVLEENKKLRSEITELAQKSEKTASQLREIQTREKITSEYRNARRKAAELLNDAKISRKEFDTTFGDENEDILAYCALPEEERIKTFSGINFWLEKSKERVPSLKLHMMSDENYDSSREENNPSLTKAKENYNPKRKGR